MGNGDSTCTNSGLLKTTLSHFYGINILTHLIPFVNDIHFASSRQNGIFNVDAMRCAVSLHFQSFLINVVGEYACIGAGIFQRDIPGMPRFAQ